MVSDLGAHQPSYLVSLESPQVRSNKNTTIDMAPVLKKYKAAAVNAEPGWFDLEESTRRTIHWIDEAGKAGCKFIAFPELCEFTDWIDR